MWSQFLVASVVAVMAMYVPGYLFWRALRFGHVLSLACAPLASVSALSLLGIVFQGAGVPVNGAMLLGMVLATAMVLFGIMRLPLFAKVASCDHPSAADAACSHPGRHSSRRQADLAIPDAALLVLYIVCGLIVCAWVFLANIGSPDAFFSRWDNQTHLSLVRAFLDSGEWSSLHTDQYLASAPEAIPYLGEPGFYPAAWHVVVATACSLTGCGVTVGINAVNSVFMGVVLPVSVLSFMKAAFPDDGMVVLAGAVAASGSTIFPWWFFTTGPLYPNFAGLALVLAPAGAGITLLAKGLVRRKWFSVALLALCSVVSLALMHPNTLFYLFIVLAAYGASHLFGVQKTAGHGALARVMGMATYLVVLSAFWYACYRLPFLQDIVQYPATPGSEGIAALVTLGGMVAVEPIFATAALGGLVLCCRDRRFWLAFPAVFMGAAYVASQLDPSGIGQVIGGFWYADFRRLGSCFGFSLIPLAACGMGRFAGLVAGRMSRRASGGEVYGRHSKGRGPLMGDGAAGQHGADAKRHHGSVTGTSGMVSAGVALAVVLVIGALNLFPSFDVDVHGKVFGTGFGTFTKRVHEAYNPAVEHVYSTGEIAFVNQALDQIPQDALVVNQPNDGSTFAYAVNDMNTYYRHCRVGNQTEDSQEIRLKLVDYAGDPRVQEAVRDTGAGYVLLLDQGVRLEDGVWLSQYSNPAPWKGIDSITDDTPGFSVVLSEGDMRLYHIDAVDEAA